MNDGVQRLAFDLLARESGIVLEHDSFAGQTIAEHAAAFLGFQFFGARHRNPQPHRNIIGDVIAADRESAALFYRAVDIKDVIGCAAADIDDKRAEIFLVLREHNLSGCEGAEDDVLHFERQFFNAPNCVLNSRPHTVNNVEVGLELLAEHADGIEHAVLPVDVIMLNNRVEECVLRGNAHFARVDLHVFHVLVVNLITVFR